MAKQFWLCHLNEGLNHLRKVETAMSRGIVTVHPYREANCGIGRNTGLI